MAAAQGSHRKQLTDEQILNGWNLEFYISKAFDAFREGNYTAFSEIKDIVDRLIVRPIHGNGDKTAINLLFMQFLSRINDGDRTDITYQSPLLPLESALWSLERICEEVEVPQQELERVHTCIREMLVIVCIKRKDFTKASEMLNKYFSKGMDSVGKKMLFTMLVERRCSSHYALNKLSFGDFKQDMLNFMEGLFNLSEPFLTKMLRKVRATMPDRLPRSTETPTAQGPPLNPLTPPGHGLPASPQSSSSREQLRLCTLRRVYALLASELGVTTPFSQLEEEVYKEAQERQGESGCSQGLELRLSESPPPEPGVGEVQRETGESAAGGQADSPSHSPSQSLLAQQPDAIPGHANMGDANVVAAIPGSSQQGTANAGDAKPADANAVIATPASSSPADAKVTVTNAAVANTKAAKRSRVSQSSLPGQFNSGSSLDTPPGGFTSVTVARLVMEEDSENSASLSPGDPQLSVPVQPDPLDDDPLCSLPTHSPPVRIPRKRVAKRNNLHVESESPSPELTPPQDGSDPPSAASACSTQTKKTNKRLFKRSRIESSSASEEEGSTPLGSPGLESPSSNTTRAQSRRLMDVSGTKEHWSDEESLFSPEKPKGSKAGDGHGKRKLWTEEETDWIKEGVTRFGLGRWGQILRAFPFKGRSSVNIKDRWRTMVKLNLV